jgi:predicted permease
MDQWLDRLWARLVSVFKRSDLDRDFDEEAESHLALAVDDYVQRGIPIAEAQRLARLKFGSVAASKDAHRDSRGLPWLEGALFDVKLALRGLRRDRGFTAAAIVTLSLAIGLNATVFTVMDAVLYRGYPLVERSDRVLFLQERGPTRPCCMSFADFSDWRAQAQSFEAMAFIGARPILFRDGDGRPADMRTTTVSANTFELLGVAPILGRSFVAADEEPGAPQVTILNHRFWVSRFEKRADIIGSTVQIDGLPSTIIGVMPERFEFPYKIEGDMWLPVTRTPEMQQRGLTSNGFTAVARLRDGVTLEEARAELEAINRRLEAAHPETNRGVVPTVATHSHMNSGPDAAMIWGSLWVGAWFVLLIGCANLANLTLVRTIGRWREFATKIALGAGQMRMIRQVAVESAMLAAVAGTIGWWLTKASVSWWDAVTASQYQVLDYTVDARTLAYLIAITVVAAAVLSLAPMIRVIQLGTSGALKGDARGVSQSHRGKHLAGGLVAAQMALAIILLAGSGVLMRSFVNIVGADSGVRDPDSILVGFVRLPSVSFPTPELRRAYFDRLETALASVPGVESQSLTSTIPMRFAGLVQFEIEGKPSPPDGDRSASFLGAGSNYFQVARVMAVSGRAFNDGDDTSAPPVAIVNRSFAETFWPGEDPVGKRLRLKAGVNPGAWRVVVGVVPNIRQSDPLRQTFKPLIYVPMRQGAPALTSYFLARTTAPMPQVQQAVRAAVQALDPDVPLTSLGTLDASFAFDRDFMDAEHSELGKHAKVAPVFAVIALLLSAVGLIAVVSHSVSQRTKEIGVRMAIGAAARDISRMVLREGLRPVGIGMVVGLAASAGVNRVLQSQLIGVSPHDPITIAAAAGILAAVGFVSCQLPARRALRVDPVVALRHE